MALHGYQTLFDSSVDNSAQALKASAGQLYSVEISNIAATDGFLQLFDLAAANVTVGTTVPKLSLFVPKGDATNRGAMDKNFGPLGLDFQVAMSYAFTTTATGNTALATAGVANFIFL